jgi:hypothetical protein
MVQLSVENGLRLYASHCLDRDPKAKDDVLWYALPINPNLRRNNPSSIEMIGMTRLLLEKGADPNTPWLSNIRGRRASGKTPWELFLSECYEDSDGYLREVAPVLIHHGADLEIKIKPSHLRSAGRLDVRTCLLSKRGYWPGVSKKECERQVDLWLAEGRARLAASSSTISSPHPPSKPSGPSEEPSLRARFKRLLA